jgi:hypothetical protein
MHPADDVAHFAKKPLTLSYVHQLPLNIEGAFLSPAGVLFSNTQHVQMLR